MKKSLLVLALVCLARGTRGQVHQESAVEDGKVGAVASVERQVREELYELEGGIGDGGLDIGDLGDGLDGGIIDEIGDPFIEDPLEEVIEEEVEEELEEEEIEEGLGGVGELGEGIYL